MACAKNPIVPPLPRRQRGERNVAARPASATRSASAMEARPPERARREPDETDRDRSHRRQIPARAGSPGAASAAQARRR